jgi:hypothetical protein
VGTLVEELNAEDALLVLRVLEEIGGGVGEGGAGAV